jgi:hypothetical protein
MSFRDPHRIDFTALNVPATSVDLSRSRPTRDRQPDGHDGHDGNDGNDAGTPDATEASVQTAAVIDHGVGTDTLAPAADVDGIAFAAQTPVASLTGDAASPDMASSKAVGGSSESSSGGGHGGFFSPMGIGLMVVGGLGILAAGAVRVGSTLAKGLTEAIVDPDKNAHHDTDGKSTGPSSPAKAVQTPTSTETAHDANEVPLPVHLVSGSEAHDDGPPVHVDPTPPMAGIELPFVVPGGVFTI